MKYDFNTGVDATATTQQDDIRLSEDAKSIIFEMFSKNIYSNPIGSVVREITSNCFDSHMEAGCDLPVRIRLSFDQKTDSHYISFIDYGVGMSPERIKDVFSVMFSSTKRETNLQIGAFGLGSKTPLAYKRPTGITEGEYDNSYFIITNHNNTKYIYQVYKGDSGPRIALMHEEKTSDHNGTEVKIPVLEKDISMFAYELKRQLYYFENIIFEGFDEKGHHIENDYKIVNAKTFLYRGEKYDKKIHVCLGKVAYPIDYAALNLDSYKYIYPIAIKLNIGDVNVTVSRENLDYNEATIKLLKKKIEEALEELKEFTIKQYDNVRSLEDFFSTKFGLLHMPNGKAIDIRSIVADEKKIFRNFKYNCFNYQNIKLSFNYLFNAKRYGKPESNNRWSNNGFEGKYVNIINDGNLYYFEGEEFKRKVLKQSYLKNLHDRYYIINKKDLLSLQSSEIMSIINSMNLDITSDQYVDDKGKPHKIVKTLIELQEEYFDIVRKNVQNYDELEVPEIFIEQRKKDKLGKDILNSTIPITIIGSRGSDRVTFETLNKFNGRIFYGTKEDEELLINYEIVHKTIFDDKHIATYYSPYNEKFQTGSYTSKIIPGIVFIRVSKQNVKYLEHIDKAHHISQYYNVMLYRKRDYIIEQFQQKDCIDLYDLLTPLFTSSQFELINEEWGEIINEINIMMDVINKNKNKHITTYHSTFVLSALDMTLNDIPKNKNYERLYKKIDKVYELQEKNQEALKYIDYSYTCEKLDKHPKLVDILKAIIEL